MEDSNNLCDAVRNEYNSSTEMRTEELELLTEIKARVEQRYYFINIIIIDSVKSVITLPKEENKIHSKLKDGKIKI